MSVKLVGRRKRYEPKDNDSVHCDLHDFTTTWGELDEIGRLCVEEGLDAYDHCLLKESVKRSSHNGTDK